MRPAQEFFSMKSVIKKTGGITMKNRKNRIVSLVLAAAMLTGCVLTGCGGNEKGAEETKKGSKEVTLWTHNGEAFVKETKKDDKKADKK